MLPNKTLSVTVLPAPSTMSAVRRIDKTFLALAPQ